MGSGLVFAVAQALRVAASSKMESAFIFLMNDRKPAVLFRVFVFYTIQNPNSRFRAAIFLGDSVHFAFGKEYMIQAMSQLG